MITVIRGIISTTLRGYKDKFYEEKKFRIKRSTFLREESQSIRLSRLSIGRTIDNLKETEEDFWDEFPW